MNTKLTIIIVFMLGMFFIGSAQAVRSGVLHENDPTKTNLEVACKDKDREQKEGKKEEKHKQKHGKSDYQKQQEEELEKAIATDVY